MWPEAALTAPAVVNPNPSEDEKDNHMIKTSTPGTGLAIAAGAFASLGAMAILLWEPMHSGNWTLDHALVPLVVGLTIAAGHLAKVAGFSRLGAAAGFAIAFLLGTAFTLYSSVGRQGEGAEAHKLSIEQANKLYDDAARMKGEAEGTIKDLRAKAAKECASGKGKRCDGITYSITTYEAAIRGYEQTMRDHPRMSTATKAALAAEVAALAGFSKEASEAFFKIFERFALALMFEWTAIVAFGYGFPHRAITETTPSKDLDKEADELKKHLANDQDPLPPTKAIDPAKKGAEVILWAREFEKRHGRRPKLNEAEAAFEGVVARTTIYRRLQEAA